jgi:hypothetical protein
MPNSNDLKVMYSLEVRNNGFLPAAIGAKMGMPDREVVALLVMVVFK